MATSRQRHACQRPGKTQDTPSASHPLIRGRLQFAVSIKMARRNSPCGRLKHHTRRTIRKPSRKICYGSGAHGSMAKRNLSMLNEKRHNIQLGCYIMLRPDPRIDRIYSKPKNGNKANGHSNKHGNPGAGPVSTENKNGNIFTELSTSTTVPNTRDWARIRKLTTGLVFHMLHFV